MLEVVKSLKIFVVKSSPSWKKRPNTSRLMDLLNKMLGLHLKDLLQLHETTTFF